MKKLLFFLIVFYLSLLVISCSGGGGGESSSSTDQVDTILGDSDPDSSDSSGSGNSSNVLNGITYANENGARTVGITGNYKSGKGGALAEISDVAIVCDTTSMEQIEDLQLIINHIVKEAVKACRGLPSHS